MKKWIVPLLIAVLLLVAYGTKPDDKTCIIAAVKAVWGSVTPNVEKTPGYFEQFMDVTSQSVEVNDWVFLKRIQYQYTKEKKTIGYGFFNHVYITG